MDTLRDEVPEVAGSIRAFAMGAAFSLVAAGFAFAVPRAILTTAERVIVEEAPIEVTEPIVDVTEEIEIEPIGETAKNKKAGKSGGKGGIGRNGGGEKDNHGAAVSTAARCNLRSRAQGELASTIAKDKDATVEDAKAACEEARAEQTSRATRSKAGENRSQPNARKSSKGKGGTKNQSSPGSANNDAPASANDSPGSASDAVLDPADSEKKTGPGESGNAPKGSKGKGGTKNQSISGEATDDDPDGSGDDETVGGGPPVDHPGEPTSAARGKGPQK